MKRVFALFFPFFVFISLSYAEPEVEEANDSYLPEAVHVEVAGTLATEVAKGRESDELRAQDVGLNLHTDWIPLKEGWEMAFWTRINLEKKMNQELGSHEENESSDNTSVNEDLYQRFYNNTLQEVGAALAVETGRSHAEKVYLQAGHGEVPLHLVHRYDGILLRRSYVDKLSVTDTNYATIGYHSPKIVFDGSFFTLQWSTFNLGHNSALTEDDSVLLQYVEPSQEAGRNFFVLSYGRGSLSPKFSNERKGGIKSARSEELNSFGVQLNPSNDWRVQAQQTTNRFAEGAVSQQEEQEELLILDVQKRNILTFFKEAFGLEEGTTAQIRYEKLGGFVTEDKKHRLTLGLEQAFYVDEEKHASFIFNVETWGAYKTELFGSNQDTGIETSFTWKYEF